MNVKALAAIVGTLSLGALATGCASSKAAENPSGTTEATATDANTAGTTEAKGADGQCGAAKEKGADGQCGAAKEKGAEGSCGAGSCGAKK
jgi:uncharacterized low-complexity protein